MFGQIEQVGGAGEGSPLPCVSKTFLEILSKSEAIVLD